MGSIGTMGEARKLWAGQPGWLTSPLGRLLVAIAFLAPVGAQADSIRVAVASNFALTLEAVAERFEQTSGHEVVLIPGSTGKHFTQISQGAPFDLFFAADALRPQRLEAEGRVEPGSRYTYALGRLVVWSSDEDLVDSDGAVLASGGFRFLAIANERLAPYGEAARQTLEALGLWDALEDRLVRGENVAQAFQFVASGNADLGMVARAQVLNPEAPQGGSWWLVPGELHAPIEQDVVMIRDRSAARELMDFMHSPQAQSILIEHGYEVPPADREGADG